MRRRHKFSPHGCHIFDLTTSISKLRSEHIGSTICPPNCAHEHKRMGAIRTILSYVHCLSNPSETGHTMKTLSFLSGMRLQMSSPLKLHAQCPARKLLTSTPKQAASRTSKRDMQRSVRQQVPPPLLIELGRAAVDAQRAQPQRLRRMRL